MGARIENMGSKLACGFAFASAIVFAAASPLAAQDASPAETEEARRLFGEGIEALESEAWEIASQAFERSYELVPRASTLLNLATAQAELGQVLEAVESYRRFLAEADRRQLRRHRREAERAIAELEPRIAHVSVSIPDLEEGDVVRLDNEPLPMAAMDLELPMSPGLHVLEVRRVDDDIGRLELVLVEGEHRGVTLVIQPREPVAPPILEAPPEESDDTGIWVGVGIGAGVAAIALGVVLGVVLAPAEEPFVGNLGPGAVEF